MANRLEMLKSWVIKALGEAGGGPNVRSRRCWGRAVESSGVTWVASRRKGPQRPPGMRQGWCGEMRGLGSLGRLARRHF